MKERKATSVGSSGIGCFGAILLAALVIGAAFWAFGGYDPRDAAAWGLGLGAGLICGIPALIVLVGLLVILGAWLVGVWERRGRRRTARRAP